MRALKARERERFMQWKILRVWMNLYVWQVIPWKPPAIGHEWSFQTRGAVAAGMAVTPEAIYFGSGDHALYALDRVKGTSIWSFKAGAGFLAGPVVAGDTVYAAAEDGTVYAVARGDGSETWRFPTGSRVLASPVVARGAVYVTSDNGTLYCIR
jgi:outer membrane protein assembly factor BamB